MQISKFFLLSGFVFLAACDRSVERPKLTKLNDYDDCILLYMSGVSSDVAAIAIQKSCKAQSRSVANQDAELPADAIGRLDGNGRALTDSFRVQIYNGNSEWILTQVTIALAQKKKKDDLEPFVAKQYTSNVTIDPLTAESFSFSIVDQHPEYDWGIASARGIKLP